jgi:hypothetical protein
MYGSLRGMSVRLGEDAKFDLTNINSSVNMTNI